MRSQTMVRMPRTIRPPAGMILVLFALAACGGEEAEQAAPAAIRGPLVGQEIWITYESEEHAHRGRRLPRTPEEARALAASLRARVEAGEDIGALARKHSNAPGALADGFSGWLPVHPDAPDARDRAMASTPIGELTPTVEWQGGWWFGRRRDLAAGKALAERFRFVQEQRVRMRAIAFLYVGAWPKRYEVTATKEQAIATAEALLEAIQAGESFEALAERWSNDEASGARGGLLMMEGEDGEPTPWIAPWAPWIPASLLRVAFDEAPVGEVHPEVIVSPRGVFLLKVEERRPPRRQ